MKEKLDGIVLDIEFIIISVIQGVALTFLAEGAKEIVGEMKFEYWFYIASGFLFILIFYSQAIIHALSFVRWPPDLGHNFLYLLASFIEVMAFTNLANPKMWFILVFVFFTIAGILYIYDLLLMQKLQRNFERSLADKNLYRDIIKQQRFELVYLIPSGLLFNFGAILLITIYPNILLEKHYHILIAGIQSFFTLLLLVNSVHSFKKRAHLITEAHK